MASTGEHSGVDGLSRAIGEQLPALRARVRPVLSQEEVAREARRAGLNWTRATVAALETGRRRLTPSEVYLLPSILNESYELRRHSDTSPKLTDLIAATGEPIRLSDRVEVSRRILRQALNGGPVKITAYLITEDEDAYLERTRLPRSRMLEALWQALPDSFEEATRSGRGEAEQKAARRLGVPSGLIGPAAYLTWGHSLTAERDRRVSSQLRGRPSRATVAAKRGRVTRFLDRELRDLLVRYEALPSQDEGEAE